AVGEEIQAGIGAGSLRERSGERLAEISASPQTTGFYEREGLLDCLRRCGNWLRLVDCDVLVKQDERETVGRPEVQQRSFERTVTALKLVPLHGQRVIEEKDDAAGRRVRSRRRRRRKQRLCKEEARLGWMSSRRGPGRRWKRRLRITEGGDGERVRSGSIQLPRRGKVFAQRKIVRGEAADRSVRILPCERQRKELTCERKVLERKSGVKCDFETEARDGLVPVLRGCQRQREVLRQAVNREPLAISQFKALGRVGRNGRDTRAECGLGPGVGAVTLTRLQQTGIDGLVAQPGVEFFRATTLKDDRGNAHRAIPDSEV